MKKFFASLDWKDYLYFGLASVAFLILIWQYIPCVEDTCYRFRQDRSTPICSLNDVFQSQVYDYRFVNGRFLTHSIVQILCALPIAGPILFSILSSIAFGVLLLGLIWLVRAQGVVCKADKYVVTLLLALLVPCIGRTFLGHIAFVVNYLWGSAIFALLLCIYFYLKQEKPKLKLWQLVLLCLGTFLGASWNESFSIAIGGALFFYYIVHFKEVRGPLFYFLLAFATGALAEILAPGNFARFISAGGVSSPSFAQWIVSKMYFLKMLVKHSLPIVGTLCLALLLPICQRKRTKQFLKENYLFVTSIGISILFSVFASAGDHQFTIIALCLVVLFVRLWLATFPVLSDTGTVIAQVVVGIVLVILYLPIYYYRNMEYKAAQTMQQSMLTAMDSVSISTDLEHFDREVLAGSFFRRYTNDFVLFNYTTNCWQAQYSRYLMPDHKVHTVVALPEPIDSIVEHCVPANQIADSVYLSPRLKYYIIKIPVQWEPMQTFQKISTVSTSQWDKLKDKVKHRSGKGQWTTLPIKPLMYPTEDCYRYFVLEEVRYIICPQKDGLKSVQIIPPVEALSQTMQDE